MPGTSIAPTVRHKCETSTGSSRRGEYEGRISSASARCVWHVQGRGARQRGAPDSEPPPFSVAELAHERHPDHRGRSGHSQRGPYLRWGATTPVCLAYEIGRFVGAGVNRAPDWRVLTSPRPGTAGGSLAVLGLITPAGLARVAACTTSTGTGEPRQTAGPGTGKGRAAVTGQFPVAPHNAGHYAA
jgi:hypothetical protein